MVVGEPVEALQGNDGKALPVAQLSVMLLKKRQGRDEQHGVRKGPRR